MDLINSVIAITGAGRGLGREIAVQLANQGAKLALIDLHKKDMEHTVAECSEVSPQVEAYACDVSNPTDVDNAFRRLAYDFQQLNGLVNNAGITKDGLLVKKKDDEISFMSLDDFNAVINVNLTGSFLCARDAAALMIKNEDKGCIINISSICRHGNIGQTNYSASKAGVQAMSVVWAKELARYGIRSNSIAPGYIGTEMVTAIREDVLDKLTAKIPAGRLGEPEEIAKTVQFILENDYVNGECLEVNGGLRI